MNKDKQQQREPNKRAARGPQSQNRKEQNKKTFQK